MGAFSSLQRVGTQAAFHSHMVQLEAAVHIVVPVCAGLFEELVRKFSTFSWAMLFVACAMGAVVVRYDALAAVTMRTVNVMSPTGSGFIAVPQPSVLSFHTVRTLALPFALFFAAAGFATFVVSSAQGRG
jgi:hypothetical protein